MLRSPLPIHRIAYRESFPFYPLSWRDRRRDFRKLQGLGCHATLRSVVTVDKSSRPKH